MSEYLLMIAALAFDNPCDNMWPTMDQAFPGEPMPFVGEYQESAEDILSEMIPEQYQHIESRAHLMAPITHEPRYLPYSSSTSAPWSTYSLSDDQIRRRPHSDEVLFAPEQTIPSRVAHLEYIPQQTGGKITKHKENSKARLKNHGGQEYYLENVGRPPPGNPVGPPPSVSESYRAGDALSPGTMIEAQRKGGRHGRLDPQSREAAWKMRKIRSCWNCVFVRGKV